MNNKSLSAILIAFTLLAGCTLPAPSTPAAPTPTPLLFPTSTLSIAISTPDPLTPGVVTPPAGTPATSPGGPASICNDPQVTALIDSFKSAILNANGELFGSLVSPARGMDVAFFREGATINYDQNHAKFLFVTTYQVDWGAEPGSGAAKRGAFHDVVVPKLKESFNQATRCSVMSFRTAVRPMNLSWPYQGEFYSVYFPGTEANGNMDWHNWVMGIEYASGKPYVYALMQFFWEP